MTRFWSVGIGAVTSLALVGIFGSQVMEWSSSTASHTDRHRYAQGIRHIDVDTSDGKVVLSHVSGTTTTVEWTVRESLRAAATDTTVEGDTLKLSGNCAQILSGHCSVTYVIGVPDGVTVDAYISDGSIAASGLNGPTTLQAVNGSVDVSDQRGNLKARAASGDVSANDVEGDEVDLHTSSGDIDADLVSARRINAGTGSGDVQLGLARVPDSVDTDTGSGDTTILLPRGQEYDISTELGSGQPDYGDVARNSHSPHRIDVRAGSGDAKFRYGS